MDSKASTASGTASGRFGKLLIRMFMKQVRVTDVETVAESFRLVTLESPQFKGVAWSPGQKVQIAMGSAFVARTFTPIEWDAVAGRTRILGYMHGQGPGNDWLQYLHVGDACDVFGPRASLDVSHLMSMPVVFGDETSIGLLCALAGQYPLRRARFLLEVNEAATAAKVLARMGIDEVELLSGRRAICISPTSKPGFPHSWLRETQSFLPVRRRRYSALDVVSRPLERQGPDCYPSRIGPWAGRDWTKAPGQSSRGCLGRRYAPGAAIPRTPSDPLNELTLETSLQNIYLLIIHK